LQGGQPGEEHAGEASGGRATGRAAERNGNRRAREGGQPSVRACELPDGGQVEERGTGAGRTGKAARDGDGQERRRRGGQRRTTRNKAAERERKQESKERRPAERESKKPPDGWQVAERGRAGRRTGKADRNGEAGSGQQGAAESKEERGRAARQKVNDGRRSLPTGIPTL
jgi:hypothetical protein